MPYQLQYAANLTAAVQNGSLAAAKVAYAQARPYYEQIEVRHLTVEVR